MPTYYLSKFTHLCVLSDASIFLDLRRGRYLGLSAEQSAELATVIYGWPAVGVSRMQTAAGVTLRFVDYLATHGLLTRDPTIGKDASAVVLDTVTGVLVNPDDFDRPSVRVGQILQLSTSCLFALWSQRRSALLHAINALRARRLQLDSAPARGELTLAVELLRVFLWMRPWFYTPRDNCLYDSLALTHLLLRHGIAARLVLGVKNNPFAAHAWVQYGPYSLNSRLEIVDEYRPILAT